MHTDRNIYTERKFDTWTKGMLHLFIVILLPVFPVFVYLKTGNDRNYFFFLILTVLIPLIYEFLHSNRNCHIAIKIENIVSSVALMALLIWDIFNLSLSYTNNIVNSATSDSATYNVMNSQSYDTNFLDDVFPVLLLFLVPVATTLIEVIRAIIFYFQKDSNKIIVSNTLSDKVGNV